MNLYYKLLFKICDTCMPFFAILEYVLISSIIITIAIFIIFIYKLSKFHLFNILIIYLFFLLINHDSGLVRHGIYNFLGFIFLLLFLSILICFVKFSYYFSKRLKYKKIFFVFVFVFFFFLYFYSSTYLNLIIYHVKIGLKD